MGMIPDIELVPSMIVAKPIYCQLRRARMARSKSTDNQNGFSVMACLAQGSSPGACLVTELLPLNTRGRRQLPRSCCHIASTIPLIRLSLCPRSSRTGQTLPHSTQDGKQKPLGKLATYRGASTHPRACKGRALPAELSARMRRYPAGPIAAVAAAPRAVSV
jgi:hypothetical protein